jgi:hypothetical protein
MLVTFTWSPPTDSAMNFRSVVVVTTVNGPDAA